LYIISGPILGPSSDNPNIKVKVSDVYGAMKFISIFFIAPIAGAGTF
jgi:hypothetical protein